MRSGSGGSENSQQRGFAYLAVLAMLAAMALLAFRLSDDWMANLARDKEQDLLFYGDEIARAIEGYYKSGPVSGCYPPNLEVLLADRRNGLPIRHLRKIHAEPVGGGDWMLVKDTFGGIIGVRSSSEKSPFKQKDFPKAYRSFNGKTRYADWIFTAGGGMLPATSLAVCRR